MEDDKESAPPQIVMRRLDTVALRAMRALRTPFPALRHAAIRAMLTRAQQEARPVLAAELRADAKAKKGQPRRISWGAMSLVASCVFTSIVIAGTAVGPARAQSALFAIGAVDLGNAIIVPSVPTPVRSAAR